MASTNERRLFGTDGIRGTANKSLTVEIALKLGQAAGRFFTTTDKERHLVLIGKDPRLSGYMFEGALMAGFSSAGMDVRMTGPIPTPGMAMLVRSMRADLGVMISASHNSFEYNGIKLFDPNGNKLSDDVEARIEELMRSDLNDLPTGAGLGRVQRIDGAADRYVERVKDTFPRGENLEGIRVVIDCANGAAYQVAPTVLRELGAEVFVIGAKPDGLNINDKCGSTAPDALIRKVHETRADIGIALDGDADRVLIVDEKGAMIDGDQILAIIATAWGKERIGGRVVGTILTNLGLERYLNSRDIELVRAKVGDRYVLEAMRKHESTLGGEGSGHIIMSEYVSTGDGLIAALQILALAKSRGVEVSELAHLYEPVPQIARSVYVDHAVLETDQVKTAIRAADVRITGLGGRLVVRPSGTEPLVRVMVEGDDRVLLEEVAAEVEAALMSG